MRRFAPLRRFGINALCAATLALACAGCDVQPADISVPGTGVSGPTYHLRIEFADVLNLPQGAKVIANGVRIGQLTHLTLVDPVAATPSAPARNGHVVADIDIRESVRLPVGTTAELRQETPLGDVHIALTEPTTPAPGRLAPEATIPLTDTTQSPPIEDILAQLSTFIGSGAVTDLQSIVRTTNGIFPADPRDTARISSTLGSDLTDLAEHQESIRAVVNGIEATVDDGLSQNTATLDPLLTPYGVQHTTDVIKAEVGVVFVLTSLGPVGPAASWLGPALGSFDGALRAVVPMLFGSHPLDTGSPSNFATLVDLIQNKLVPFFARGPKINMVGIDIAQPTPPPAQDEQTGRIIDTLRMIGAVR
ncbi:MlaD family protein [Nocardia callitridis]|uniref:Mce/MlaD domain-containing protein n=1 Tax=Nocardia callitridis TaxID=648753 RepID=A0ABP9KS20_9NOCA